MTNTRVTTTLSMATAFAAVAAVLVSAAHAGGSLYSSQPATVEVSGGGHTKQDFSTPQSMAFSSQRNLPRR